MKQLNARIFNGSKILPLRCERSQSQLFEEGLDLESYRGIFSKIYLYLRIQQKSIITVKTF